MSKDRKPTRSFFRSPPGIVLVGVALLLVGGLLGVLAAHAATIVTATGLTAALLNFLITLPACAAALAGLIFLIIGGVRWAVYDRKYSPTSRSTTAESQIIEHLRSINDRLLISDTAKRIAYREQDRNALRRAIREDIDKDEFEAALALVDDMSQTYGYRHEAEEFRDEILAARAADVEQTVNNTIAQLDQLIADRDWDRAFAEAAKIQRLYPESHRVRNLETHVRDAREDYKHTLERQFLEASQRDDIDRAMELLKELDKYLTEAEAKPFRETARGVIGKKRDNLGVQFKMAVHDKEWIQSVRIGEQLIREFPNSQMAQEVRSMLDLLRERAASEQAARA
ncbi:MAG: hypothetical protein V3U29_03950 [Phycisphaeraceae bacterium]